jgi:dTDP-4-amino-4,6-dideoxygalactose transaminase
MAKNIGLENFLVFGAPDIQSPEISEVLDCLESGWLGTGPKVARFERDFAAYKGLAADHVAAVNSCTAALHVSMIAAGIGPGDEVITTPMTFCATVNAIIHAGATPVLADVDPVTMNIHPDAVAASITTRTRAILPVHFAGRPCEMDALVALADRHGLRIIEDAAHAIETEYHGRKAGTFGDFGCFSFYVTKNVATGEGGMVTARDEADIHRIKTLALHGMTKDAWHRFGDKGFRHYQVVEAGFKFNMMDLQAAIGLHQLARVEVNWLRRREIWNTYQQAFADLPVGLPAEPADDTRHAYHLYALSIEKERAGISRDAMLDAMTEAQIGVGVHYMAIPEHPFYQSRFGWRPDEVPHASRIGRSTITLPLSPKLSDSEVDRICKTVCTILRR